MICKLIIFLLLNFAALAIGGLFTGKGVSSDWYSSLWKAPWTPPGWVFGAAWTTIMICFSFYMTKLWTTLNDKKMIIIFYTMQWILNVVWNPTFFYYHYVFTSLIIICLLTIVVGFFFLFYLNNLKFASILIVPYFVWLLIATSLNAYIYMKN